MQQRLIAMETNGNVINGTSHIGDVPHIDGMPQEVAKENSYFKERLLRDAERIDQEEINELAESVPKKLESMKLGQVNDGVQWLSTMLERVKAIYSMVFDKEYHVSTRTKLLAGAALIYFVLPADAVPDFIPGIGFLDDALVLGALWKLVGVEISEYIIATHSGATREASGKGQAGEA